MSHSALAAGIRSLRRKLASQQSCEDSDEQLLQTFLTQRDEKAFASLIGRHGPMVMHVCRHVLGHEQDAEDAFQATFLVLAREAGMLRKKTAVASFLHGTAYRLALSAKRAAARRRKHEAQAPDRASVDPAEELSWREVRILLDEEIARLPEKYRCVFVLCCLEELSRAETAQRLGLKERTVLSRLAVARKRLGKRLARRGVELTALLAASTLAAQPASALTPVLIASTIGAAMATAAGKEIAGVVSASVAELLAATGVLSASRGRAVLMLLLAATMVGGAGLWFSTRPQAAVAPHSPPEITAQLPPKAGPQAARGDQKQADFLVLRCRVLGPDGKPVAGAKLYLPRSLREQRQEKSEVAVVQLGVTNKDGRFRLELPAAEIPTDRDVPLVAVADGFGLGWIDLSRKDASAELSLRLVKDVPIRGRLLSTEGKPAVGVTVTVAWIMAFERLDDFLFIFQREMHYPDEGTGARRLQLPLKDVLHVKPTDKDGHFEITGVGTERLAILSMKSATFAEGPILVITREKFDAKEYRKNLLYDKRRKAELFGPSFEQVVERVDTNRSIKGTVREAGSGKAVAGAFIQALGASTRTDAQGSYQLVGMRRSQEFFLTVDAPESSQLMGHFQRVIMPTTPNRKPMRVDIEMRRGVVVTGRVYDKATGKGVGECSVHFAPLPESKIPNLEELDLAALTGSDGRFRLVTVPGPGVLLAAITGKSLNIDGVPINPYKPAELTVADRRRVRMTDRMKPYQAFLTAGGIEVLDHNNACRVLDVSDVGRAVTCDLALDPGKTLTVQFQDPEGKPLAGAMVAGISVHTRGLVQLKSAACKIYALDPENPRPVAFLHTERKLAALVTLRGDEKEPLMVRSSRTGVLTGRVLDADGQPVAGAEIYMFYEMSLGRRESPFIGISGFSLRDRPPRTDKQGRFHLDTIIPGLKVADFRLLKGRQLLVPEIRPQIKPLSAGQSFHVGDIHTKPRRP
jgi:RNA polymerase sigma factor (sigma-70 family)